VSTNNVSIDTKAIQRAATNSIAATWRSIMGIQVQLRSSNTRRQVEAVAVIASRWGRRRVS
jgi:hypothetical protein